MWSLLVSPLHMMITRMLFLQPQHVFFSVSKWLQRRWLTTQSEARIVFALSNAGIVGSNATPGIDICIVCVYSMFVLFCV
jgi:hypothetical protein